MHLKQLTQEKILFLSALIKTSDYEQSNSNFCHRWKSNVFIVFMKQYTQDSQSLLENKTVSYHRHIFRLPILAKMPL